MHWYGGSIAEAVSLSKQKNAIFVVFVEGDNEQSVEMAATIDETDVLKRLSNENNFLAIKLKSGSTNYTNFARIYQFVPVPSLFFIGRNGIPLEVVCAGVQANNLATRIDRILEEHYKDRPASVQPSTSSQHIKEQTVNLLQAESANASDTNTSKRPPPDDLEPETSSGPPLKKTQHHEITKSGQEYDVVCDGDVCVRLPKAKADLDAGTSQESAPVAPQEPTQEPPAPAIDNPEDIDDKLERAKELIEARRREKAEKEKEEARQKELERRATGQGVAELKRWQADQELKQIQEERKREKMENNLARQRILEQIAQDRAERRARDVPQPAPPQQLPASSSSGDGSGQARIQLKLPDGGVHTAHFDADAALADLRQYVADTLQMSPSSFTLWTAFPRRELTEVEATLRGLQLVPSAALLVLLRRQATVVATPSQFSTILTFFSQFFTAFILEPSQQLYNWVMGRLFPAPARGNTPARGDTPPPRGPGNNPSGNVPGLRRRGNIHRLPEDRPRDDDNNTWNGNSTQQM